MSNGWIILIVITLPIILFVGLACFSVAFLVVTVPWLFLLKLVGTEKSRKWAEEQLDKLSGPEL
jgi:hypothetical protein